MDARLQQGLIEGGVGEQHRQPPLLRLVAAARVHLHHQQRDLLPDQLIGDLLADAAIAAENHVVVHALDPVAETALAPAPEVAGFGEAHQVLDGELHHHEPSGD
jgi:hypothetical protein